MRSFSLTKISSFFFDRYMQEKVDILVLFEFSYSHFRLVRTRLTHNFGLHAQKPLVPNQIALTHILYGFG